MTTETTDAADDPYPQTGTVQERLAWFRRPGRCPGCRLALIDPAEPCSYHDPAAYDRAASRKALPGPLADLRVIVGLLRLTGRLAEQWASDTDNGLGCHHLPKGFGHYVGDPEVLGRDMCMAARLLDVTADRLSQDNLVGWFRDRDHDTWGGELRALAALADGELTLPDDDPDAPVVIEG